MLAFLDMSSVSGSEQDQETLAAMAVRMNEQLAMVCPRQQGCRFQGVESIFVG